MIIVIAAVIGVPTGFAVSALQARHKRWLALMAEIPFLVLWGLLFVRRDDGKTPLTAMTVGLWCMLIPWFLTDLIRHKKRKDRTSPPG